MVLHAYHPSCAGSVNRKIKVWANLGINKRFYSEKYLKQKGLGEWLNGEAPTKQAQGPEFKPWYCPPKKNKTNKPRFAVPS
jgi:hypothetical protein